MALRMRAFGASRFVGRRRREDVLALSALIMGSPLARSVSRIAVRILVLLGAVLSVSKQDPGNIYKASGKGLEDTYGSRGQSVQRTC